MSKIRLKYVPEVSENLHIEQIHTDRLTIGVLCGLNVSEYIYRSTTFAIRDRVGSDRHLSVAAIYLLINHSIHRSRI